MRLRERVQARRRAGRIARADEVEHPLRLLLGRAVVDAGRPERESEERKGDARGDDERSPLVRAPGFEQERDRASGSGREGHEERQAIARRDEEGGDEERVRGHERRPHARASRPGKLPGRRRARGRGLRRRAGRAATVPRRGTSAGGSRADTSWKLKFRASRRSRATNRELLREQPTSLGGMVFDPRPRAARKERRHLARRERPPRLRLGDLPRVGCRLAGDGRRDPGERAVDAVRAGPVPDEEVQAAVRGDEDGLSRDDQVAREGKRDDGGAPARNAAANRTLRRGFSSKCKRRGSSRRSCDERRPARTRAPAIATTQSSAFGRFKAEQDRRPRPRPRTPPRARRRRPSAFSPLHLRRNFYPLT